MADWTSIPDATFDPDRPVLGSTHLAVVKNFEAFAEGAVGAPRVTDAALGTTVTSAGTDWVAARITGVAAGSVGTYAFLRRTSGSTDVGFGSTLAGSSLTPASALFGVTNFADLVTGGGVRAGTWRAMGYYDHFTGGDGGSGSGATLWLRIL